MRRERVRTLLTEVAAGRATIDAALTHLDADPVESLPFATIDHHRALLMGFPEVVFAERKSVEQVVSICERLVARGDGFLVTRASSDQRVALRKRFRRAVENTVARTVRLAAPARSGKGALPVPKGSGSRRDRTRAKEAEQSPRGSVLIVTAGTADLPVAEEAEETLRSLGVEASRLTDVGVAGIHRVLAQHHALRGAGVVIVVAGMDGALPSVIGGLVRSPVIAVPTSVGYGASFDGLAALLTMLNSCAAGVTVCNIDNGFGAAVAAFRILSA
ncbi:MAG: nickel pincer cofactor biosynthesis protein LarB [Gemmatimonadales bacterium]